MHASLRWLRHVCLVSMMMVGGWAATPSTAEAAVHVCSIADVAVFPERVHVRCTAGAGAIRFFAVPTEDAIMSSHVLSMLLVSYAEGFPVRVDYDPADTSATSFGCAAHDCRRIRVLILD